MILALLRQDWDTYRVQQVDENGMALAESPPICLRRGQRVFLTLDDQQMKLSDYVKADKVPA